MFLEGYQDHQRTSPRSDTLQISRGKVAHVLFNALNCTRILAGWLKQRGAYKRIRGTPQNAFGWELSRKPSLELWGSSNRGLSSTQDWLPAVLCSPYYRVGSLHHCARQMSALWHLACSPLTPESSFHTDLSDLSECKHIPANCCKAIWGRQDHQTLH